MDRTRLTTIALGGAAAGVLVLGGCAQPVDETPAGPPTATATTAAPGAADQDPADPTPSDPGPTDPPTSTAGIAAGFAIPECAAQIDEAEMTSLFGDDVAFIADTTGDWMPEGPAAQEALASAEASVSCIWGVPNSGRALTVAVVDLEEQARDDLLAALRDTDTFGEEQVDSATVFTAELADEIGQTRSLAYVFDGAAWISVGGGELGEPAMVRDAALIVRAGLQA